MVSAKPVVPELIWNFLLANAANSVKEMAGSAMRKSLPLADIMPVVLTTRPSSVASAKAWFNAVSALQKVARRRFTDENDLRDSIDKVLAAGNAIRGYASRSRHYKRTTSDAHIHDGMPILLQEQYKIQSIWGKLGSWRPTESQYYLQSWGKSWT